MKSTLGFGADAAAPGAGLCACAGLAKVAVKAPSAAVSMNSRLLGIAWPSEGFRWSRQLRVRVCRQPKQKRARSRWDLGAKSARACRYRVASRPSVKARSCAMGSTDSIQRGVLPIPDRKPVGLTTYDAKDKDTKFPPIASLRPPAGAPNVLVILLDDVGFGASSAFGGPCL